MFAIRHATLLTPEDSVADALVLIDEGRIAAVDAADASPPEGVVVRDATGLLLAPGFIDLQLNGGFGLDFTADPTTIWDVAAALPRTGSGLLVDRGTRRRVGRTYSVDLHAVGGLASRTRDTDERIPGSR